MFKPPDTKIKRQFAFWLIFSLILTLGFSFASAEQTAEELAAAKTANEKKLQQINKQIKNYQQQIATTQAKSSTLKNEVFIYDKQISSTELQIQGKETQIEDANLQIVQLEDLIAKKLKEIADNKKVLGQLIIELKQYDDQYALKTTIGSDNLSDFLDQFQFTQNLQSKIYQLVQKIKDLKAKLEGQKRDLEIQVKQLEELKTQLEITKNSLTAMRGQKQSLLNQTRGLEKNFQKLLSSSKEDEINLQKEIQDLDAKIRAKLGNKSIPAAKGVLAWPMDWIMTQSYGNTGFTALGYNFHNGIDIAAPAGQPIYAAADGEVLYTDKSDASYGNWIAIKHNISTKSGSSQIITLYGHFRSFKVSPGQQVKQGDIIGYEGNTGNTTKRLYGPERGYHIHFGVYDAEGFGVSPGVYTKIYGDYKVPYGYTYNPLNFLGSN
ncbi:MAG: peptidoglycan DD-metalloendopeptidase family protein [Patescibacteria group bacterium]